MSKESLFFIYLIERYTEYKSSNAASVLSQWDNCQITELIFDMYERYHTERIENAFEDIDAMIAEKNGTLR